jgi:hypothetical protein
MHNQKLLRAVKAELREEQLNKFKKIVWPYLEVVIMTLLIALVFTTVVQAISNVPQEVERIYNKQ